MSVAAPEPVTSRQLGTPSPTPPPTTTTSHTASPEYDFDPVGEPGQRGRLSIADHVVEKVAAQAVTEVDLATGAPRTVLGRTLLGRTPQPDPDRVARADAHIDGQVVTLSVSMAVQWPAPVREVAAEVRRHLSARIDELTGLRVAEVDVDVTALVSGRRDERRVQ